MKRILSAVFLASSLVSNVVLDSAVACTDVVLNKTQGIVISGRTLDFDSEVGSKICFRPSGTKITDPGVKFAQVNYEPTTWTSKYDSILVDAFEQPVYCDGMNSQGLSVATLWQTETEAAQSVSQNTHGMANVAVVEYLVENAKTIEEAKALVSNLSIVRSNFNGMEVVLHWIVTERSGRSIVIELKDGRPKFFEEVAQLGVLTNSPTYDNQIANLKVEEAARTKSHGYGLPGDYRPTSRFVKAAYLVSTTPQLKSCDEGMTAAMQILHNVEVPKGAQDTGSYTQWMVVRDQTNLRYWLLSSRNPVPQFFDLKKLDFGKLANSRIPIDTQIAATANTTH